MEVMSSSSTASSSSPIEKSHSTLYSISTKSMISDSGGGGDGECGGDYHNSDGNDDYDVDGDAVDNRSDTRSVNSDFELTYCEGDVTLMDEDFSGDATNDAEKMFLQIVEILRDEQEVCALYFFFLFFRIFTGQDGFFQTCIESRESFNLKNFMQCNLWIYFANNLPT